MMVAKFGYFYIQFFINRVVCGGGRALLSVLFYAQNNNKKLMLVYMHVHVLSSEAW